MTAAGLARIARRWAPVVAGGIVLVACGLAFGQEVRNAEVREITDALGSKGFGGKPVQMMAVLAGVTLVPFVLVMTTSFIKMIVVFSVTRSALALQQVPPTEILTGMALLMTVYVMAPVGVALEREGKVVLEEALGTQQKLTMESLTAPEVVERLQQWFSRRDFPVRAFLERNADAFEVRLFRDVQLRVTPEAEREKTTEFDFSVLAAAFAITELKESLYIGFILFLPFLLLDMIISTILLGMQMSMLTPTTVSAPFKLLVFVIADGWHLITKGLITGYI